MGLSCDSVADMVGGRRWRVVVVVVVGMCCASGASKLGLCVGARKHGPCADQKPSHALFDRPFIATNLI